MKFILPLLFMAVAASVVPEQPANETVGDFDHLTDEQFAALCGEAGVMEMPEGTDPKFRRCNIDPADGGNLERGARDVGTSPTNIFSRHLSKRKCYYGPWKDGCSKDHWCWARCGSNWDKGYWCWTAVNWGKGGYAKCTSHLQCDHWDNDLKLDCKGGCSC